MGCASSGPVKDLAAAATNGASENLKKSVNNAMEDAAHLDFEKAEEDLKQVGEGLKESVVDGVNDLMENVMGHAKPSLESREDGDGGSVEENPPEDPQQDDIADNETALESTQKDGEAAAKALEEEKQEPNDAETTETEDAPIVVDAGDNGNEG